MKATSLRSIGPRRFGAVLLAAFLLVSLLPGSALAAASVTSATGGGAISADTAGTPPGNGTYASLTGPSIVVTTAGDIGIGTITITRPAGFEFATTSPDPSVSVGATGAVAAFTSATTSVLTFTVTGANTGAGTVVFSGVRVRPTVGFPLAASGELQVGGSAGVSDATSGLLTEVAGAAILSYQTTPSTSATAGTALAQQPVVLSQDQFGNVRSGDSILLSSVPSTGGFSCTTNPKLTNGSGLASFTGEACKFTTQGSYVIRASVAGGTPVDSATITVAAAAASKLVFTTQPGHGTPSTVLSPQPVNSKVVVMVRRKNGFITGSPLKFQVLVPPTVSPSIRTVGWPTPTGTLWPSLPQVPTPLSSAKSLPIMDTRVSTSGPLPIRVAPLTG